MSNQRPRRCTNHDFLGPLPVIGGPGHEDIVHSLKTRVPKILKLGTPEAPRAIICVTAHWSENQPAISSADHHDLYYDYGGLPNEAYRLKYNAPGSSAIAHDVKKVLMEEGLAPVLNRSRGEWILCPDTARATASYTGTKGPIDHEKLTSGLW